MKSNTKKGIHCDLYTITCSNGKITANKLHKAQIIKKSLIISGLIDGINISDDDFYNEYSFDYSYNIPFDKQVPIKGKKDKDLNTKITYKVSIGDEPFEQICYTYFNRYQRIRNSRNFKRRWIQQANSIMWIINIVIALLAVISTLFVALITLHSNKT